MVCASGKGRIKLQTDLCMSISELKSVWKGKPMTITTEQNGSTLIISPAGRIDTNTAPEFGEAIEKVILNATDLIFDLDELEYISSAGLRMFLKAQKEMNRRGSMKLINVSGPVYEVLEATGFTGISDVFLKE